jgi:uncharacterized coiled-coil protein SlyX
LIKVTVADVSTPFHPEMSFTEFDPTQQDAYSPNELLSLLQPTATLDQQQQQMDLLRTILNDVVRDQTTANDPWLTSISPLDTLATAQKPTPSSKLVPLTMSDYPDEDLPPSTLDPETYRSLSSKERRQMRNKISARNFRVRRKEYIQQLEQQAAEQQHEMQVLKNRIVQLESENSKCREELEMYKNRGMRLTPMAHEIHKDRNTSSRMAAERVGSPAWMEQRLFIHHVQVPEWDALYSYTDRGEDVFVPLEKFDTEVVDEVELVKEWIEQFAQLSIE